MKVTTVGNSTGVILPKEVLARLSVKKGDTLFLTEIQDGYRLSPFNPEFERQMQRAYEGMDEYRDALRELAK
ncbi:MAG TPA: AbrB/MazE/SpoVT family DNA-binding domain-containing protein [Bryobacteraceae bacterium]|nr:AbrB/MazE/SpoVT family DNA-binding domain-containing protein [Bryobacteraceae bacterium]